MATNRWQAIRCDLSIVVLIAFTSFYAIFSKQINYHSNPGLIGIVLTRIFQISVFLNFTFKIIADVELQMNAVERMTEYIEKPDQEAVWTHPQPKKQWLQEKAIQAENLKYKYREDLPQIIHGIDFNIHSCEKIGIVGRTGSGKSTITLGLLRMLEIFQDPEDPTKGKVSFDDQDVAEIGLHYLRQKCTIIP